MQNGGRTEAQSSVLMKNSLVLGKRNDFGHYPTPLPSKSYYLYEVARQPTEILPHNPNTCSFYTLSLISPTQIRNSQLLSTSKLVSSLCGKLTAAGQALIISDFGKDAKKGFFHKMLNCSFQGQLKVRMHIQSWWVKLRVRAWDMISVSGSTHSKTCAVKHTGRRIIWV